MSHSNIAEVHVNRINLLPNCCVMCLIGFINVIIKCGDTQRQ